MKPESDEILFFINQFRDAQSTFLNGCCYWFAFILKKRFGGSTYYHPIQNHFSAKINGAFYDVTGKISGDGFVSWKSYKQIDEYEYERIVRDCIDKVK